MGAWGAAGTNWWSGTWHWQSGNPAGRLEPGNGQAWQSCIQAWSWQYQAGLAIGHPSLNLTGETSCRYWTGRAPSSSYFVIAPFTHYSSPSWDHFSFWVFRYFLRIPHLRALLHAGETLKKPNTKLCVVPPRTWRPCRFSRSWQSGRPGIQAWTRQLGRPGNLAFWLELSNQAGLAIRQSSNLAIQSNLDLNGIWYLQVSVWCTSSLLGPWACYVLDS